MIHQLTNTTPEQQARPLTLGTAPAQEQRPASRRASVAQTSLSILQRLQTTLDVPQMIQFFAEEVAQLVSMDGIEFSYSPAAISCHLGRQSRHQAAYRLTLGEEALGTMTFRRGRKFDADELKRLEELLCSLLYPLRNALAYASALLAARRDALTGLNNRAALHETLERELSLAQRHEHRLSLVVLDIDHFKQVNDRHGHLAGDTVLRHVGRLIRECTRETDVSFRYGGEEFVILLNETPADGAEVVAQRLRETLARTPVVLESGETLGVTASFGVAELAGETSAQQLFERADAAMYRAKQAGRNRVARA